MSEAAFLKIEDFKVPYIRFGSGPKLMIAFPGYGDRKEQFEKLSEALSDSHVVYALDLPGHGESDWPRDYFSKSDFQKVINKIFQKENQTRVSFMGYSFGGRAVLSLVPHFAKVIDKLYLLAPDGLDKAYYNRATFLPIGIRKLLQRFLKHHGWYIGLVAGLSKIGLLKNYSYQFVKLNFANAKRRKRLFLYWNSLDDFQLNPENLKNSLNDQKIFVEIILGARDHIIPAEAWKDWAKGVAQVHVEVLDEDHRLIGAQLNAYMTKKSKN